MIGSLFLLLLTPSASSVVPASATLALSATSPAVSYSPAGNVTPNGAVLPLVSAQPTITTVGPVFSVAPAPAVLPLSAVQPTIGYTAASFSVVPAAVVLAFSSDAVSVSFSPLALCAPAGAVLNLKSGAAAVSFDATTSYHPVTLAEAKAWLKVETGDEDALVGSLIGAAADYIELTTGIVCAPRTDVLTFACFDKRLPILRRPLRAVTAVAYTDSDGTDQTLASAAWKLKIRHGIMTLQAASGTTWPTAEADSVEVTADVGYLSNAEVPDNVKLAAREYIAQVHMNREGGTADLSGVDRLLAPYRAVVA